MSYEMVTQKMIAEKAGVSYSTVSRAFTRSASVKPGMMRRIRAAMTELGINDTEDLFLGRSVLSRMVLVVVGSITNEFFANIIVGISDKLKEKGYSIVLCNSNYDTETEILELKKAEEDGFAGVIMVTVIETEQMLAILQEMKIPVILVNRHIRSLDLDIVRIDNYRGGYMSAQCLIDSGHRRIAHLSGPKNSSAPSDRLRGFTAAMQDNGIPFGEEDIMYGDLSRESGKSFASWTARKDYTAVYIGNDYMTAGAIAQFAKLNMRVPDDISIICFDDSPLVNRDSLNITSVSCDPRRMGDSAADILMRRIADPLGQHFRIVYSPKIIYRESIAHR